MCFRNKDRKRKKPSINFPHFKGEIHQTSNSNALILWHFVSENVISDSFTVVRGLLKDTSAPLKLWKYIKMHHLLKKAMVLSSACREWTSNTHIKWYNKNISFTHNTFIYGQAKYNYSKYMIISIVICWSSNDVNLNFIMTAAFKKFPTADKSYYFGFKICYTWNSGWPFNIFIG